MVDISPLFKNTVSVTSVLSEYYHLYGILPDIMLRYTNELSKYQMITYFAWHELTHASQVQSMINNKGYDWASGYWSANAGQQATNSVVTGHPYGAKGNSNWQIIALSEGWANYREWLLGKDKLGYDIFSQLPYNWNYARRPNDYVLDFPRYYAGMYDELQLLGCSYYNIERSLPAYSFSEFRDNLKIIYPTLSVSITSIVNRYEAYNF